MNDDTNLVKICKTPIDWTGTIKSMETCTLQPVLQQASSNDRWTPSAIIAVPILVVVFWKLSTSCRRAYKLNKAIGHLQKILMLERMLQRKDIRK